MVADKSGEISGAIRRARSDPAYGSRPDSAPFRNDAADPERHRLPEQNRWQTELCRRTVAGPPGCRFLEQDRVRWDHRTRESCSLFIRLKPDSRLRSFRSEPIRL